MLRLKHCLFLTKYPFPFNINYVIAVREDKLVIINK